MHAQCRWACRETQVVTFQRFAIEVDVEAFRDLDFDPWQPDSHKHVVDAEAIGEQGFQGADDFLRRRQNTDVQQTVVSQRFWSQHMSTAGLPAIADAQCQQVATPLEIRPLQLAIGCMQLTEAR